MKEIIILLIVIVLCYVTCQVPYDADEFNLKPIPEQCGLHKLVNHQCCVFPPFFIREVARECGAKLMVQTVFNESEIATIRREINKGCDYWICVLDKYDLLMPDDFVDDEKYFKHLDRWVDLNQNFADVILNAKIYCKSQYRMLLPLKQCEFPDFNFCIRNFVNVNCPVIIPTKECETLKEFYEECKEYYI